MVDARLFFDIGTLYQRMTDYTFPAMFGGEAADPKKLERLQEALAWFNTFLADYTFAAGNKITVADHSLVASISSMEAAGIDVERHGRVLKWLKRCKVSMKDYEEVNGEFAKQFGQFLKGKIEASIPVKS